MKSKVFNATAADTTDLYGTPPSATDLLAPFLPKGKLIWEPCAGYGSLAVRLIQHGLNVLATDIADPPQIPSVEGGRDALLWEPPEWDICVTNPPWSLKTEFFARFYSLEKPFAFLLPCDIVNSVRTKMFADFGIQLIVPSWRVRYRRFDGLGEPSDAPSPNVGSIWFTSGLNLPRDLVFVTDRPEEAF